MFFWNKPKITLDPNKNPAELAEERDDLDQQQKALLGYQLNLFEMNQEATPTIQEMAEHAKKQQLQPPTLIKIINTQNNEATFYFYGNHELNKYNLTRLKDNEEKSLANLNFDQKIINISNTKNDPHKEIYNLLFKFHGPLCLNTKPLYPDEKNTKLNKEKNNEKIKKQEQIDNIILHKQLISERIKEIKNHIDEEQGKILLRTLKKDNQGKGDCGIFAFSIAIMPYLQEELRSDNGETPLFDKLKTGLQENIKVTEEELKDIIKNYNYKTKDEDKQTQKFYNTFNIVLREVIKDNIKNNLKLLVDRSKFISTDDADYQKKLFHHLQQSKIFVDILFVFDHHLGVKLKTNQGNIDENNFYRNDEINQKIKIAADTFKDIISKYPAIKYDTNAYELAKTSFLCNKLLFCKGEDIKIKNGLLDNNGVFDLEVTTDKNVHEESALFKWLQPLYKEHQMATTEDIGTLNEFFFGHQFRLVDMDNPTEQEINFEEVRQAKTPLLVRRHGQFSVYSDPQGGGNWQINDLENVDLNLLFDLPAREDGRRYISINEPLLYGTDKLNVLEECHSWEIECKLISNFNLLRNRRMGAVNYQTLDFNKKLIILENQGNYHWVTVVDPFRRSGAKILPKEVTQYASYMSTDELTKQEIQAVISDYHGSHNKTRNDILTLCKIDATTETIIEYIKGNIPVNLDKNSSFYHRINYLFARYGENLVEELRQEQGMKQSAVVIPPLPLNEEENPLLVQNTEKDLNISVSHLPEFDLGFTHENTISSGSQSDVGKTSLANIPETTTDSLLVSSNPKPGPLTVSETAATNKVTPNLKVITVPLNRLLCVDDRSLDTIRRDMQVYKLFLENGSEETKARLDSPHLAFFDDFIGEEGAAATNAWINNRPMDKEKLSTDDLKAKRIELMQSIYVKFDAEVQQGNLPPFHEFAYNGELIKKLQVFFTSLDEVKAAQEAMNGFLEYSKYTHEQIEAILDTVPIFFCFQLGAYAAHDKKAADITSLNFLNNISVLMKSGLSASTPDELLDILLEQQVEKKSLYKIKNIRESILGYGVTSHEQTEIKHRPPGQHCQYQIHVYPNRIDEEINHEFFNYIVVNSENEVIMKGQLLYRYFPELNPEKLEINTLEDEVFIFNKIKENDVENKLLLVPNNVNAIQAFSEALEWELNELETKKSATLVLMDVPEKIKFLNLHRSKLLQNIEIYFDKSWGRNDNTHQHKAQMINLINHKFDDKLAEYELQLAQREKEIKEREKQIQEQEKRIANKAALFADFQRIQKTTVNSWYELVRTIDTLAPPKNNIEDIEVTFLFETIKHSEISLTRWPEINTLEGLLIAEQKNRFVDEYIKSENKRLNTILRNPEDERKLKAYEALEKAILASDPDTPLSSLLQENSKIMQKGVAVPKRGASTIQNILYSRFEAHLRKANSKKNLNAQRASLTKMNPRLIIPKIIKQPRQVEQHVESDKFLQNVKAASDKYSNSPAKGGWGRSKHKNDFIRIQQEMNHIINHSKGNTEKDVIAMIEILHAAFYEAEQAYGKSLSEFITKLNQDTKDYQYPRILMKLLRDAYKMVPDYQHKLMAIVNNDAVIQLNDQWKQYVSLPGDIAVCREAQDRRLENLNGSRQNALKSPNKPLPAIPKACSRYARFARIYLPESAYKKDKFDPYTWQQKMLAVSVKGDEDTMTQDGKRYQNNLIKNAYEKQYDFNNDDIEIAPAIDDENYKRNEKLLTPKERLDANQAIRIIPCLLYSQGGPYAHSAYKAYDEPLLILVANRAAPQFENNYLDARKYFIYPGPQDHININGLVNKNDLVQADYVYLRAYQEGMESTKKNIRDGIDSPYGYIRMDEGSLRFDANYNNENKNNYIIFNKKNYLSDLSRDIETTLLGSIKTCIDINASQPSGWFKKRQDRIPFFRATLSGMGPFGEINGERWMGEQQLAPWFMEAYLNVLRKQADKISSTGGMVIDFPIFGGEENKKAAFDSVFTPEVLEELKEKNIHVQCSAISVDANAGFDKGEDKITSAPNKIGFDPDKHIIVVDGAGDCNALASNEMIQQSVEGLLGWHTDLSRNGVHLQNPAMLNPKNHYLLSEDGKFKTIYAEDIKADLTVTKRFGEWCIASDAAKKFNYTTVLARMLQDIPVDDNPINITRRYAMITALCGSQERSDRELGQHLTSVMLSTDLQKAHKKKMLDTYPHCYYAQLALMTFENSQFNDAEKCKQLKNELYIIVNDQNRVNNLFEKLLEHQSITMDDKNNYTRAFNIFMKTYGKEIKGKCSSKVPADDFNLKLTALERYISKHPTDPTAKLLKGVTVQLRILVNGKELSSHSAELTLIKEYLDRVHQAAQQKTRSSGFNHFKSPGIASIIQALKTSMENNPDITDELSTSENRMTMPVDKEWINEKSQEVLNHVSKVKYKFVDNDHIETISELIQDLLRCKSDQDLTSFVKAVNEALPTFREKDAGLVDKLEHIVNELQNSQEVQNRILSNL